MTEPAQDNENPEALEFPIVGEDDKKRFALERRQEKLAEEEAWASLGCKLMRVTKRTQAKLGKHLQGLGIKKLGLYKLVVSGDKAEEAIAEIEETIQKLLLRTDPPTPASEISALQHLKLECIKEMRASAQAHFDADKAASEVGQHELRMAFPAGTQMAFATGGGAAPKEIAPREIEE